MTVTYGFFSGADPSTTPVAVDLSTVPAGGGVLLLASQYSAGTPTLSLDVSSGWTEAEVGGAARCYFGLWYIPPGSTVPSSVNVQSTTSGHCAVQTVMLEADTAIDAISSPRGTSNDVKIVTAPGVTVAADSSDLLLLAACEDTQDSTPTIDGGMTVTQANVAWSGTVSTSTTTIVGHQTHAAGASGDRTLTVPRQGRLHAWLVAVSPPVAATDSPAAWVYKGGTLTAADVLLAREA